MLKREAFAYFGVDLRNPQNAWSGRNEEHNLVVFSIYPVYFDIRGMYRFHRDHAHRVPLSPIQRSHGLKWLIEDFNYAVENTNRIVHAVWLEPYNYGAEVWETNPEYTEPCKHLLLKLVGSVNEDTGYFEAQVLRLPPELPIQPTLRSSLVHRTPGGQELHFHPNGFFAQ